LGRTNQVDLTRGSILMEAAQGMQLNRATETNPRLSARIEPRRLRIVWRIIAARFPARN
jgi:hypothetical protein